MILFIKQSLRQIDKDIVRTQSSESIVESALENIRKLIPCWRASVALYDDDVTEGVILSASSQESDIKAPGTRIALGGIPWIDQLKAGKTVLSPDLQSSKAPITSVSKPLMQSDVQSALVVPLMVDKHLIGSINLTDKEAHFFSNEHQEIVEEVANQLAIALHQNQLHEQIQQRVQELTAVHQASQQLQKLQTPEVLAQAMIQVLEETLSYEYGAVLLVDSTGDRLIPYALSRQGKGLEFIAQDKAYILSHNFRGGKGITGWVAQTGQSVRLGDVRKDPRYYSLRNDIRSELCVPLCADEQIIGVVNVETTQLNAYTEADQRVLETVAAQFCVAIQNSHLLEQVKQNAAELEERVALRTAELEAANKELEAFTYSVSHDLKAPLRGIDGYSQLLLEDYADQLNEDGRSFLYKVRSAAERMNQLIEDLLTYSRLERKEMRLAELDIQALANSLVNEHTTNIENQNTLVNIDIPFRLIKSDLDGLAMALRNLIENAFKFSRNEPAPQIKISGQETKESYILWVQDNGIGFDTIHQERIFEIFQRLHRSEDFPGTGIGLALVRKAMDRLGGKAWAESEPGKGATFYLELKKYHDN